MSSSLIRSLIRDVQDFPKPGIVFKDITPLLADPNGFKTSVESMAESVEAFSPDGLVAIESRGFIFCSAMATVMGLPMHLIRKPGKLPHHKAGLDYDLEYGSDRVEIHLDAIQSGKRYAVVDDVLATGGTARAASLLVEQQQGQVVSCNFLMELGFLNGRSQLTAWPVTSLVDY